MEAKYLLQLEKIETCVFVAIGRATRFVFSGY
jgi:hypothetical protein